MMLDCQNLRKKRKAGSYASFSHEITDKTRPIEGAFSLIFYKRTQV